MKTSVGRVDISKCRWESRKYHMMVYFGRDISRAWINENKGNYIGRLWGSRVLDGSHWPMRFLFGGSDNRIRCKPLRCGAPPNKLIGNRPPGKGSIKILTLELAEPMPTCCINWPHPIYYLYLDWIANFHTHIHTAPFHLRPPTFNLWSGVAIVNSIWTLKGRKRFKSCCRHFSCLLYFILSFHLWK